MTNLHEAFKRIAKENYDKSKGWSAFTECYDDKDIASFIDGDPEFDIPPIKTDEELLRLMTSLASVWDDGHAHAAQFTRPGGRQAR